MCCPLMAFRPSLADGWSTNHVLVNTMVSKHLATISAAAKALRGDKRGTVVKPLHTLTTHAVFISGTYGAVSFWGHNDLNQSVIFTDDSI